MTYEEYLNLLRTIKPSQKPELLFGPHHHHLLYDQTLSLKSKVRIALGITDYEAGYPGCEACFADEEEFERVTGLKFEMYLHFWEGVSAGIGDG